MLHRINLPDCTQHLEWVVWLQNELLHALCDRHIAATGVIASWVKALRPDIDGDWMERFCSWSKNGKSILERMQAVAALPDSDKQAIIDHYEADIRYAEAFDDTVPPPPATTPLPGGLSDNTVSAYREFFEMFYAPMFYKDKGYPIIDPQLAGKRFTKNGYLDAYHAANPALKVCPLCDGGMDGAELDHWLAKKHFPELNCHPQNLVEICGACNSGSCDGKKNKGENLALDENTADPFDHWFHPYLRPACGQFRIEIKRGVPRLASNDPAAQKRLDGLDGLINLSKRWTNEHRNVVKGIQQRIRNHRRRGKAFDQKALRTQLESWKIDAEGERGTRPHKLLEECLLTFALLEGSDSFVELLQYATG